VAITALPTPPSRQDPTNFAIRADAFLGALPIFGTEANQLADAITANSVQAVNSALAANTSATAASNSATLAASLFDSFDDRYLGAKAASPTVDNDGNPLITGALYWNSAANEMRVWSGSTWVASVSTSTALAAAASAEAASTSAANSANSATSSASSAVSAASSAASAANSFDSFDDRYLGSKNSNPTTDNDGATLLVGALYWNTLANEMRVWNATAWVSVQSTSAATSAASSVSAASASATAAANSASAASVSAAAAAASYDSFDDRYLGAKSTNPTVDNDNEPLIVGALYWNIPNSEMRTWVGTSWVQTLPTEGVTSFNGRIDAVILTKSDIETAAYVFTSGATANTAVLRDADGNFSANNITVNNVTASNITATLFGNANTATRLLTPRTIGGVSFDGTAGINLPGVNTVGNQNTSGNAATATRLLNPQNIGGVSFDGTASITLPGVNTTGNQNTTGNAATATRLLTPQTIGGVSFDGSASINLPGVNTGGNQNTSGSAARLTNARTIQLSGGVTGSASFDGSANININCTVASSSVNLTNWTIEQSGTDMVFKLNGVVKLKLDANGGITAPDNITAFGTP